MPLIAPSILSADFGNLADDIDMINRSEADWIHCDIMDGRFVPNISFGFPVLYAVKKIAKKPLDVHLMIVEPEKYVDEFARAGANILSVHLEASPHLHRTIYAIKEKGMSAGVVLNPHTSVSLLENIIADVDLVLLMSVNPGYGGQKFIPGSLQKVKTLAEVRESLGLSFRIEIDGGVALDTVGDIVRAGAELLVAGNAVFGKGDVRENAKKLLGAARSATLTRV